ncbi:coagulation factor VIII isoform X2 [Thalassophryne amazonica]|uniref:coagulation factor VIII isoform X2 n=1 Tax=Thalassophryne amazonica TaxID=390379 RepID=UPI001470E391|nr:coagulation factor VIII isoform X2 [Thalassophryne amazonica]
MVTGEMTLTLVLLLSLLCSVTQAQNTTTVRHFYIAAVEIGWDYIHLDHQEQGSDQRLKAIPQKYIKAVYREYTDSTYSVPNTRPAWTGIQGPVINAAIGDRVVVHFKNLASQPYSISPVGITYWKQSEGAGYDDSTTAQEKEDDAVSPGGYYEYIWDISPKDGPTISDPECLTYSYSSQVDTVRDANSGLIGALLICKSSAFKEDGQRRNPAFVLLFAVFDETKSWYGQTGQRISRERFKRINGRREYHTINGYVNSTLSGLTMCQSQNHVFWHVIGMGTAPEIHSIKFQDHTLQVMAHRKVTMEVTPMTFSTAEMKPATVGQFLISCQIYAHRHDGMNALFTVEKCPDPVSLPGPNLRNVQNNDHGDYSEEYSDEMFNTIMFQPKKPYLQARASRGQQSKTRKYYIAAEEITWDYAPHLKPTDSELQSGYFLSSPRQLDYKYKKVVFVEFRDASFTKRKKSDVTLLGPLLKGEVNDQFHITFKNLASRPYNIYPIGLTKIYPLQRSTNAAEKDLRSMGVAPNDTFDYIWRLTPDDGPLEGDPQCLTQLYQSTVSPEKDLSSGLVGILLICKNDVIDVRGRLLGPDKEWSLIFSVFDENKSWYSNENIYQYIQDSSRINTTDPDFYNSNVIYSVNGIMFHGRQFVMCQTDVTFWHVANVGTQSDFLSVYFMGNLFQYLGAYQSVLTLFPMTGKTISMETELAGEWEISAFDGSLKSRGMSIHYTVRPCDTGDLPLVDVEDDEDDILDYIDQIVLQPRASRPQNHTVMVRVCKTRHYNRTQSINTTDDQVSNDISVGTGPAEEESACEMRNVTVTSLQRSKANMVSVEEIPQDVLEELEKDGDWKVLVAQKGAEPGGQRGGRQTRQAEGNWTDIDTGLTEDGGMSLEIRGQDVENRTHTGVKAEETSEMLNESDGMQVGNGMHTGAKVEEINEMLNGTNGTQMENGTHTGTKLEETSKMLNGTDGTQMENGTHAGTKLEETNEMLNGTDGTQMENGTHAGTKLEETSEMLNGTDGTQMENGTHAGTKLEETNEMLNGTNGTQMENGNHAGTKLEETNEMLNGTNGPQMENGTHAGTKLEETNEMLNGTNGTQMENGTHAGTKLEETNEMLNGTNWTQMENGTHAGTKLEETSEMLNGTSGTQMENGTHAGTKLEEINKILDGTNRMKEELKESDEILLNGEPLLNKDMSCTEKSSAQEMEENLLPQNSIEVDPDLETDDPLDIYYTVDTENGTMIDLSIDYDDYSEKVNATSDLFGTDYMDLRSGEIKYQHYYIAAEEVNWDYGIRLPHQIIQPRAMRRGMRKFLPEYKKVVFRAYRDKDFLHPVVRGEIQDHLGIMGPLIRAEINELLTVIFKNKASRPYSFHLQGVYDRSQGAGLAQTYGSSAPAGIPGAPVAPGEARAYSWRVTKKQGPDSTDFDCKAGAYYSTVDKEKDLHSGLIGPLIICKPGSFQAQLNLEPDFQEFALLFHTFDETKSWYLQENLQKHCSPPCQANPEDPWYQISNKFAAINGYVAETLPGLLVAQHQLVRWHLLNVGSDGEYHAVHFRGLPFTIHTKQEHRMGIYNLFPGVFGTVEMRPPTVGTWLVECTIGENQLAGMRAKLLVYNPQCVLPLGMKSGRIEDSQITASNHFNNWEPRLARLELSGYINAWIGKSKFSWLQVDLRKPTLLHGVQTQGVRVTLKDCFITHFTISYSLDQETWTTYRGHSKRPTYIFNGNMDSSKVKENRFSPPTVARYIRIQPVNFVRRPALRLELLGCDLNSCSLPLGLRNIPDSSFSASSVHSSLLRTWSPALARLHQEGRVNAWRPKNNNPHEWLQVDLGKIKRITGVLMQGARSFFNEMMVTEFSVTVSHDGHSWNTAFEEDSQREKIFTGSSNPDEESLAVFDPPLFGRYLRIHPRGWVNDIALRLEVLGCDTQQSL